MEKYDQPTDGLRRIWIYICKFFVLVSIIAELLVFIAQIIVVSEYLLCLPIADTYISAF